MFTASGPRASDTLISPERLRSFFRPRSVAMVGASDKSAFSMLAYGNLMQFGFGDHTYLVNPRSPIVHGRPTVANIGDIDEPVDVAFLMVPQEQTLEAMSEAAEAGIRNAVVLSSGYGEAGAVGRRAQEDLVEHARKLDMLVLGPNHLGFVNFVDHVPVAAIPGLPDERGSIALLSQSGASSMAMLDFAVASGNNLSYLVTLGNEAMITAGHALEYFVQDEATRAVAIFLETIREPETFRRAALAALDAGKAVVCLKAGSSQLAARTATAHTGALVGDDRVIDAMFRDLGVIRVDSIEDMMVTAGLAALTGPVGIGGLAIASVSGGACDIIADRAENEGIELSSLTPQTVSRLLEVLPEYATPQNPLDVTGTAVIRTEIFRDSIRALADDPSVAIVGVVTSIPMEGDGPFFGQESINAIGVGAKGAAKPVVLINQIMQPLSSFPRGVIQLAGIPFMVNGLGHAVRGFAGLLSWSGRRRAIRASSAEPAFTPLHVELPAPPSGTWSENDARILLARAGIPVAPSVLVTDEGSAVATAAEFGGQVAMKIVSPDILHKSDIGGVRLNVDGEHAVRGAYRAVISAGSRVRGARIDGVLVAPMRPNGIELLVGATRDPQWGPILAIALGGIFVEIFGDSVLTSLPVSPQRVGELLQTLKAAPLLDGARGTEATDIGRLATVISRIGDLVLSLGDGLESLEVNPLRVAGDEIEALDALVTWASVEESPAQ